MQAVPLPALAGWTWVRDGWSLFRTQPLAFFSWAMFVSLMLMIATITPPIGPLFFIVLMPTATLLSLSAGRHATEGRKILLGTWIEPLKKPLVFRRLLGMGSLYVLFCLLLGLAVFMPFSSEVTEALKDIEKTNDLIPLMEAVRTPMAIFAMLYVVMAAIFWFAPALVGWHGIRITQALFFSWIACWRNKWAFLVYGLCWLAVFLGIDTLISMLVLIGLAPTTAASIQIPINVVATSVLYCSFYTSYVAVFDSNVAVSNDDTNSV
ncbi:MAG: BPSS1780 family membrane protein [Burkholderiaceae bacterium]|jgi:hypothetical protein|nr:BPSS1780 family membrane protein [Burkholderiaceae bacterium]MDP4969416.1 BPSS1780 family membrane protein [Burkholderiaceae bacterium]MDP5111405.1 BPSS1780 family membrane protein [Burkholderiaceae bacterium]